MHNLRLLLCCIVLAGCSRGTVGSLPIASDRSGGAFDTAQRLAPTLAHKLTTFKSLYSFTGGLDGAHPTAPLIYDKGTLYGTTPQGGAYTLGTVFKITPSGTETVLHSFKGNSDGATPGSERLINVNGALFGTTTEGGASNNGTVFRIGTSGKESVIYSFKGGSDGALPEAALLDYNGVLYGTTVIGGTGTDCPDTNGCGTVFKLTTSGAETVIHNFVGGSDGSYPEAGLIVVNGALYGTTVYGGTGACTEGCGTVFKITTSGSESVLHSFGNSDGNEPFARLLDLGGTLYGTTRLGGAIGYGTVFKISTSGNESVVYSFTFGADGGDPWGGLIAVNGALYGTTEYGANSTCNGGCGTVFSLTPSGTLSSLYSFTGKSDGGQPTAGLVNVNGTLYGTTSEAGGYADGTVFSISL
jgi:uncharacterized repeat protein (TIGR03803 family)